ncbi:CheR family methyltransferase [Aestuariirhabdus litorea]|uniref:protein-glutamate O-methyltransferase n=1 Tax=Aestuariirhabdus litorea TaxID=2528527 RepID=A0A3P3VLG1_9GAMM|nr:CheR family methyltransferase [Aestuariirhabdus litorea]RRJ82718.1 protein-glutamate O-methyltransferase CheR [Aestuariirhabdus litorea]RWW92877.1 protein-glutamate O-methyltransferase CheR [Endozoicomonadaceae bacterium GTF-13]
MMTNKWSMQPLPEMDESQFEQWQALLESRTGMRVTEQRKTFLQTSVGMRMRELGLSDYQNYYNRVSQHPPGGMEWTLLVDRLTVQETSFFRHQASFDRVQRFLAERSDKGGTIEIWSVGCSTGEEPYSLAMLAQETLQDSGCYFGISATDISAPALAKARQGIYSDRKVEALPRERAEQFFTPLEKGRYQVVSQLRDRVCFSQVNVLELSKTPMHGMDLIYCQNLLIYFRRWRRKEILNRLAERLAPGGLLVVGLGEVVDWSHPDLERDRDPATLAFRKRVSG